MDYAVVTRNASYQPLRSSLNDETLLSKLLPTARGDAEVHIRSVNGLKMDCSHACPNMLILSADAAIYKQGKLLTCKKCDKFAIPGKIDLRFKPWPDVRKYSDCHSTTMAALISSGLELPGLTYRLGKIRERACKNCNAPIHPHLPRGTEWRVTIKLTNQTTGLALAAHRNLRCFVDTSGHKAAGFDIKFETLMTPTPKQTPCSAPSVDPLPVFVPRTTKTLSLLSDLPFMSLPSSKKSPIKLEPFAFAPLPQFPDLAGPSTSKIESLACTSYPSYLRAEATSILEELENDDLLPASPFGSAGDFIDWATPESDDPLASVVADQKALFGDALPAYRCSDPIPLKREFDCFGTQQPFKKQRNSAPLDFFGL